LFHFVGILSVTSKCCNNAYMKICGHVTGLNLYAVIIFKGH
jgi:hypothetical protein